MRARARLTDRFLGPAQYEGRAPLWLVTEGLLVACAGMVVVAGAGVASVLGGMPPSWCTAAVLVAAAAVLLYLLITRAGHLFVALAAALGALLASDVPGVTADVVLRGAGHTQDVIVTVVSHEPTQRGRSGAPAYYCSVRRQDGSPVAARLWRGCGPSVSPGDLIGMVQDPAGRVPPRGVEGPFTLLRGVTWVVALLLAFALVCLLAVLRSYRVPSAGSVQPRGFEPVSASPTAGS
ncbi:hypothetical protein [Streptomyces sp. NBC_01216]|uniref:hypothetical protein n=1 Tax=unclassified Streptomyces TaxID=2593676 RepID=UPI002E13A893|nr:hypothetical protein OG393_19060 [Streptomyces sp. NBC_01216]